MPVALENTLRKEAFGKNLTGTKADAYVFGTLNKLGLLNKSGKASGQTSTAPKQRIQPFLSTGIPGIRKGKKVSLKAITAPIQSSPGIAS